MRCEFNSGFLIMEDSHCKMRFDIEYMCANFGKKNVHKCYDPETKKHFTETEVILPLTQVRKIMKFICKYCDDKSVLYEIRDYLKRRCPKYIEYMKV